MRLVPRVGERPEESVEAQSPRRLAQQEGPGVLRERAVRTNGVGSYKDSATHIAGPLAVTPVSRPVSPVSPPISVPMCFPWSVQAALAHRTSTRRARRSTGIRKRAPPERGGNSSEGMCVECVTAYPPSSGGGSGTSTRFTP